MARRLERFPGEPGRAPRRYPWAEWTDGAVWEIVRDDDYDVATENMRVNLHLKAEAQSRKVRTKRFSRNDREGLVFQFLPSEEGEAVMQAATVDPSGTTDAIEQLYADAVEIYERARAEVRIERKDGRRQRYAAVRYKQQIDKGREDATLVPTIARILRRPTLGFGHLEHAERPDLMVETLVLDPSKPYHRFFSSKTLNVARARMDEYYARHPRVQRSGEDV